MDGSFQSYGYDEHICKNETIGESKDKYSYLIGNALRPEDEAA